MDSSGRRSGGCVFLAVAIYAVSGSVQGQSTLGSVRGVVRDNSGATVAGARLTLRNLDENTASLTVSSGAGGYEFLNVKPGRFAVTAEKSGFTLAATPEFLLDARRTKEADLTLIVSGSSQNVTVSAQLALVDTEDGTISDSKNFEEITRLPLNFRAGSTIYAENGPLQAVLAVPGVHQALGYSLSGALPGQIEISIDGISALSVRYNL